MALSILLLCGCTVEEMVNEKNVKYDPSGIIEILTKQPITRGTPITNEDEMTDMGVFCSYTGTNDWTVTDAPDKMFNHKMIYNAGKWDYDGIQEKWNATTVDDRFTFFAYAPFASSANGIQVNGTSATKEIPTLTYTVPTDVTKQPDLMVAIPRKNTPPLSSPVTLQMRHALTCVGFQVAGDGNKVSGIAIRGVSMSGTLSIDGNSISWSNLGPVDTSTDFSASLNTDEGKNYYTATPTFSTNLMKENGYLMMIPQTLGSEARIIITEEDGNTIEIGLDTYTWQPGKQTNYKISIVPDGTVTIVPSELLLPWFGVNQLTDNIEVICNDEEGNPSTQLPWSLTTDDTWFSMTLNSDGSNATQTVSGKGSATVYTLATENTSTSNRTTTVYLNGEPGDVKVNVVQVNEPGEIPGGGEPPQLTQTYVGAFWKADQTGERIIKIDMGTASGNLGKWSAYVYWMDSRWNQDDIMLAAGGSSDPNIYGENPGTAESFPVTVPAGTLNPKAISGTVDSDNSIVFRIGLKNTWNSQPDSPARYAVVLLSYNNYSKHQKIFLRQGHGDDYLVHPNDANQNPYVRIFSPYNVKAVGLTNNMDYIQVYKQGTTSGGTTSTTFTEFPSQAGSLFRWAGGVNNERRAWHPTRAYTDTWDEDARNTTVDWASLAAEHETCPDGYRRPRYSGTIDKSDPHQSLLTNPNQLSENSVYGYYADGYFDRRRIVSSLNENDVSDNLKKTTVNRSDMNVAYIGRLVFNNKKGSLRENASIFFPAAGYRLFTTGAITNSGQTGHYWLGTGYGEFEKDDVNWFGYNIGINKERLNPKGYSYRAHAFPIRCIK